MSFLHIMGYNESHWTRNVQKIFLKAGDLSVRYMITSAANTQSTAPIHATNKIIYDGLGHMRHSRRKHDLSSEMVWGGSGSKYKRIASLPHTYLIGLKSDDYDRQSTRVYSKACFRYKILADNASLVKSGVIVHRNRTSIRGCKKWANIDNITREDMEIREATNRNLVSNHHFYMHAIRGCCWPDTEFQVPGVLQISNLRKPGFIAKEQVAYFLLCGVRVISSPI